MLKQDTAGLEEPSASVYEVIRDDNNEHCETAGPCLAARLIVQQKVKYEQPMVQGRHPPGAPKVTEFATHQPYTQVKLVNLGMQFQKREGEAWQHGS